VGEGYFLQVLQDKEGKGEGLNKCRRGVIYQAHQVDPPPSSFRTNHSAPR
jgi:hypothetical protein